MTLDVAPPTYQSHASAFNAVTALGNDGVRRVAAGVAATLLAMDPVIVRTLSEAAANKQQSGAQGGEGRNGAAPVLELPAARLTLDEASALLAGIINRLPLMLLASVGAQDPAKTEEGATVRATEGVAAQVQANMLTHRPEAPTSVSSTDGVGAAPAPASLGPGFSFTQSSFVNSLILLREILLQLEASELKNSANMTVIRLDTARFAAAKQEQAAVEAFASSIASSTLGLAVGTAAMQRTYKSTSAQTDTIKRNQAEANKTNAATEGMRGGAKTHATPSAELRPSRNLDGSAVPAAKGHDRAAADLQGDLDVNVVPINLSTRKTGLDAVAPRNQEAHAESMAKAQNIYAQANLANMMVSPLMGGIQAVGNIQSQSTLAVGDLAKQEVDIHGNSSKAHQEQVANNRALREATAQLFISLLALQQSTNDHIAQRA